MIKERKKQRTTNTKYFESGGFVVVDSVTSDNNVLCYRLGAEDGEREEFDIDRVIKRISKYKQGRINKLSN